MRITLTLILIACSFLAIGQAPLIQTVAPINAGTQGRVIISGSGFSPTASQLVVLFDNIKANIIAPSTDFSIQVDVPPQARMSNVEVINLTTGLSGKSALKFIESFGGATFVSTNVSGPTTFPATRQLFDICTCDFDLDGKPDLAATKFAATDDPAAFDLMILKNKSTPGVMGFDQFDKTNLPALNVNAPTFNMNCGDLNGDGKPDLVASRQGGTRNAIFFLKNTNSVAGTLSFAAAQPLFIDAGQFAFRVSIRDLNQDGKPELIVSNSFDDPATDNIVYVFVNQSSAGAISFNATPVKVAVTGANTSYGMDVQDLDGDGKPEIIVNQFQSSDIFILRNQSSGLISFSAPVKITSIASYNSVSTADLNKDGLLDMMLTSTFDNTLRVFINQSTSGNISFKTPSSFATSTQPAGVDASDIDGDGDVDIIVANKQANFLNVFVNDGNASPSFTRADVATAKFPLNLKVGDLDGDAKPDMAFTSLSASNTFSLDILRNTNCVNPKILNPVPTFICAGQTIVLQATPAIGVGVTYDWRDGANTPVGTSATANITAVGNYTVTVTSEGGACVFTSPAFTVSNSASAGIPPDPTINPTPAVCVGGTLSLSTPTVSGALYLWSGPGGFSSTVQNPTISNVTVANAGLYKLQLQLATASCKSNEASQVVDVKSFPSFIVGPNTPLPGCAPTGVTLSVNSVSGYTYQWLMNSVSISGQTTTSLSVALEGDYSVQVSNASLCPTPTETAKLTVQLYSQPVANFTAPATACTNASVNFTNTTTGGDTRGTLSFAWNFGDAGTAIVASPSHTYTTAGSKSVSQTVGYVGVTGCTNVSTKPINIVNGVVPVISAPVSQSCPRESVVLTVAGTFTTILWSTGGSASSVTVTQPGNYSVNTVDANACPGTESFALTTKQVPTVKVTLTVPGDTAISLGKTVQLNDTATPCTVTYLWSPTSSLDSPTIPNPVATPLATTTYRVVVSLTGGCSATDSVKVKVSTGSSIPAPLIFTPNGDGDNDLWRIPGIESSSECTMSIFDGHGSRLYEKKGYTNATAWDGTNNGSQLPEAVYYYIFSCPDKNAITGSVLIKR